MIPLEQTVRNVTIKMVAERARVSIGTVSKVLNTGNCKPELRDRVNAAIRELGYKPNPYAQAVRSMRTRCLGILVNADAQGNNLWLNDLLLALFEAVSVQSYQSHVQFIPEHTANLDFKGLPQRIDGLILVGYSSNNARFHAAVEEAFNVPVATYWDRPPLADCIMVEIEYKDAFRQMLEHLLALGHRRVTAISGSNVTDREKMALISGIISSCYPDFQMDILYSEAIQDNPARGFSLTEQALDEFPDNTVLFYAADVLAMGGISCLASRRIIYPQEMSVVSFDNTSWSRSVIPALTGIGFDYQELAYTLVKRIIGHIEELGVTGDFDKRPVQLHLERRSSTGTVRANRKK